MNSARSSGPLVSVILPAYNAESYLSQAMTSVLEQTYAELELWVVDDGSTDSTVAIASRFAARDSRVRILRQENRGVAAARNAGIRASTGTWIAPIDADDIWHRRKLERQVGGAMASTSRVGLVYAWSLDINEAGRAEGDVCVSSIEGWVFPTLLCHHFLGNASVPLIRRDCLEEVGLYETGYHAEQAQGCEDWDLHLRIADRYHFAVIPEFLVGYRKTLHSMSRDFERMARSHSLLMEGVATRCPGVPPFVYRVSRGNLYTYFARSNNAIGAYRQALYWLRESVRADSLTPFLRLTLYQLLVTSIWGLLRGHTAVHQAKSGAPPMPGPSAQFPVAGEVGSINLELWRDRIFHRAVLFFYHRFAGRAATDMNRKA